LIATTPTFPPLLETLTFLPLVQIA